MWKIILQNIAFKCQTEIKMNHDLRDKNIKGKRGNTFNEENGLYSPFLGRQRNASFPFLSNKLEFDLGLTFIFSDYARKTQKCQHALVP